MKDGTWCTRNEMNFAYCRSKHNGVIVAVKRNKQLVKKCGIVNLSSSLYKSHQKDQMYTVYCHAIGDEIFLENKKEGEINFLEVAAYTLSKYSSITYQYQYLGFV